ncbi:hypothetical protein Tco_0000653 [Tanacetum coccineum]
MSLVKRKLKDTIKESIRGSSLSGLTHQLAGSISTFIAGKKDNKCDKLGLNRITPLAVVLGSVCTSMYKMGVSEVRQLGGRIPSTDSMGVSGIRL